MKRPRIKIKGKPPRGLHVVALYSQRDIFHSNEEWRARMSYVRGQLKRHDQLRVIDNLMIGVRPEYRYGRE